MLIMDYYILQWPSRLDIVKYGALAHVLPKTRKAILEDEHGSLKHHIHFIEKRLKELKKR